MASFNVLEWSRVLVMKITQIKSVLELRDMLVTYVRVVMTTIAECLKTLADYAQMLKLMVLGLVPFL